MKKYIVSNNDEYIEREKFVELDILGQYSCGDCGAEDNEYHEMNCDLESCPICGLQLLTCDCWKAYAEDIEE